MTKNKTKTKHVDIKYKVLVMLDEELCNIHLEILDKEMLNERFSGKTIMDFIIDNPSLSFHGRLVSGIDEDEIRYAENDFKKSSVGIDFKKRRKFSFGYIPEVHDPFQIVDVLKEVMLETFAELPLTEEDIKVSRKNESSQAELVKEDSPEDHLTVVVST